jgi:hypothetical protein
MSFRRMIIGPLVVAGLFAFRAAPEEWVFQLERVVGGREAAKSPFGVIGGISVDRSRNVIVSQPDSLRVAIFRPDGSPLATIGKAGKGAGEFTKLIDFGRIGDTLWALDDRGSTRRFHLYGPDYRFRTTVELRLPSGQNSLPPVQTALLQNGYVISQVPTPIAVGRTDFITTTRSGTGRRVVASVTSSHGSLYIPEFKTTLLFPELMNIDDFALVRTVPDGSGVIVVDRTAPARPGPATFSVTSFRPDGSVAWKRQFPYTAFAVGPDAAEPAIERAARDHAKVAGSEAKAIAIIRKAIGTLPKTISAVDVVLVGGDGTIWLSGPGAGPAGSWMVLDAAGTQIATAITPRGQVLATAQRGWAWMVSKRGDGRWVTSQYTLQAKK